MDRLYYEILLENAESRREFWMERVKTSLECASLEMVNIEKIKNNLNQLIEDEEAVS